MNFTPSDLILIANALNTVAEVYEADRDYYSDYCHYELAEQFQRQADQARELSDRIFDSL